MSSFICPFCKQSLNKADNRYVCANNHSFDIAKEGYIHLLPVHKMHSKIPGDTKEMVKARSEFLNAGYYRVFSDMLNKLAFKFTPDKAAVADAGCGEGYYTKNLYDYLVRHNRKVNLSAFDISKFAVKAAAKKDKNISFAVASIFDIPIKNETIDLVINIFAPIVDKEFLRILKPKGKLIIAVPGEYHLWELKKLVYDEPYINEYKETDYDGFRFIDRISVKDNISLADGNMVSNLFSMTPYYWKTDKKGSEKVKNCERLNTQIHFDFLIYEKE